MRILAAVCSVSLLCACGDLVQADASETDSAQDGTTTSATMTGGTAPTTMGGADATATGSGGASMSGADMTNGDGTSTETTSGVGATESMGDATATSATGQADSGSTTGGSTAGDDPATDTGEVCGLLDPEDNDLPGTATALPDLGCDDGVATVAGSLEPGDEDWFEFFSPWDCGQSPNPTVAVTSDAAAGLCVFADCQASDGTDVTCAAGSSATAPSGDAGCCGEGAVELAINCEFTSDESTVVWMQIDGGPMQCIDYTVAYQVIAE